MHSRAKRVLAVATLAVAMAALVGCQPARLRPPVYGSGVQGVGTRNFPDPSVLRADGGYFAFSSNSTGSNAVNIGVITSTDRYRWVNPFTGAAAIDAAATGDALPTPPSWARERADGGGFWAPSVAELDDRYVLYFAARHRSVSSDRPGWCIGHAESITPAGPYTAAPQPLFCRLTDRTGPSSSVTASPAAGQGSIDPQVYTAAGKVYLHFKALDSQTQLWGIRLRADGRRVQGAAAGLVSVPADHRVWEYSDREGFTVLENPSMDYNPRARESRYPYYLYYSGGDWQSSGYGTGVAACRTPLGPCGRITADEPWLASRRTVSGPGGLSHFRIGGGHWVAYHSWEKGAVAGNGRRLHIEPLSYDGLTPVLLNRRPTGTFTAASNAPGRVTVSITADDVDTGAPVKLVVREGRSAVAVDHVEAGVTWQATLEAAAGDHEYCVSLGDDNGLSARSLGCRTVAVSGEVP